MGGREGDGKRGTGIGESSDEENRKVLFDTWYGAVAAFAVALAGWFAGVAFSCLAVGEAVAHVFGLFLALSAVALVAAFVRSLVKRAWGRAAAQFGMFVLGQVAFFGVAMGALAASEAVADWRGPGPWQESREKNGVVPFEVEYRIAWFPPMFSGSQLMLDRRVAFASGKRVGIAMGTGGHFRLSVYSLGDGTHALMDGAGRLFRVDAAAETVDEESEGQWFRLPDGTEEPRSWGTSCVTVVLGNGEEPSMPVGSSLDGHRLLGQFVPYGRFVEGGEDWLTEKLTPAPWKPLPKWPEELPFALERQEHKFSAFPRWRVAFPSGKAVSLMVTMWNTPCSVQEMADGNYALEFMEPPLGSMMYRVRPGDECVDYRVDDDWVEIPADILEISSWSTGRVCGRDADNEEVCGTNSVPVGATMKGMRLVGMVTADREFKRSGEAPGAEGEAE